MGPALSEVSDAEEACACKVVGDRPACSGSPWTLFLDDDFLRRVGRVRGIVPVVQLCRHQVWTEYIEVRGLRDSTEVP